MQWTPKILTEKVADIVRSVMVLPIRTKLIAFSERLSFRCICSILVSLFVLCTAFASSSIADDDFGTCTSSPYSNDLRKAACDRVIASGSAPQGFLISVFSSRADIWRLRGEFKNAIADYTEAIRLEPKAFRPILGRADAYEKSGNIAKALADFKLAAMIDAHSEYAKESIRRLERRASSKQVDRISPNKTVRTISTGSGFFVSPAGNLLTNFHVVKDCPAINVRTNDGNLISARLIAQDEADDLAVLKVDVREQKSASLRIAPAPKSGEAIVVFGFPLSGLLASTGNATIGNITAVAGLRDDPRQLQISAPVQPGNSGGPVHDMGGNVIGIVVSKLNALRMAKFTNDIPQNINFAVKVSMAANFLEAHGISYVNGDLGKDATIPDIVERAKAYTVEVRCQGQ